MIPADMKTIAAGGGFHLGIEPEQIIFSDGLQPFLFRTRKGTLGRRGPLHRRPSGARDA